MTLLCFDISSSGIAAALFDSKLEPIQLGERRWAPGATLDLLNIVAHFKQSIAGLKPESVDAICIGTFMHNIVLLDANDNALTPVFTWLDSRGESGVAPLRKRLGDTFHQRTGCRFHPMFPVFKLASLDVSGSARAVSLKSFLLHALTGEWIEDHGMACASGLYNILEDRWDPELLQLTGLSEKYMPGVRSWTEIAGRVTAAVARQTFPHPGLNSASGAFCYKAADDAYLLGCAGNNGGNVLDWGRSVLGTLEDAGLSSDPPIFIPLLFGERSPEWNPQLTGSWHGLTAQHTATDLSRSILEGVIFNVAYFVDIVQSTSCHKAPEIVLSGNGFLHSLAAPLLATVVDPTVRMPSQPGLTSLRGAGVSALRALGPPIPSLRAEIVRPLADLKIRVS